MTRAADAPIGVFDSGVGGLTVLRALHERMPDESTVYLGDTARVPYGPKSPETIRRYSEEAASFLLDQGVKALVIACNTATAHASRGLSERLAIPVVGVVGPGASAAAAATGTGSIGVIGTRGTIDSGTYERAIRRVRPDADVRSRACPLFVALAEEGWVNGDVAELTARTYLNDLLADGIDTLVLGCTHYPLLRPLLETIVGPSITLVDSAEATAEFTAGLLHEQGLHSVSAEVQRDYFVTDDAARFGELASRFLGATADRIDTVNLGG